MNVAYRRELRHNYLIIDPELLEWDGYESRMLEQNIIEGLLSFRIRQTEDGVRFYYDITSKQPLLRLMQSRKLKAEEIRCLLIGIFGTLERMEGYLLCEKNILLNPEFLYVDPDTFRVGLCVVPGAGRDFPEDFGKFLERILENVDHQDKEAVVLAYGIYQETRKENYGVEDVMRFLYRKEENKPQEVEVLELSGEPGEEELEMFRQQKMPEQSSRKDSRSEAVHDRKDSHSGAMRSRKESYSGAVHDRKDGHSEAAHSRKQESWWSRLRMWVGQTLRIGQEEIPVQVPWEMMMCESENTDADPGGSLRQETDDEIQGTVLLTDLSGDTGNRVLRALSAGVEDIPIAYYPFIIGKQENLVDYRLDRDTVSRLHLRIDRNGGQYEIQDLNSTNGTMLRGRLLINNETDKLEIGDEISIARYRYRFE